MIGTTEDKASLHDLTGQLLATPVIDMGGADARITLDSIRSPDQMVSLAMCGFRGFTITPKLWREIFAEPLADAAVGIFSADARGS